MDVLTGLYRGRAMGNVHQAGHVQFPGDGTGVRKIAAGADNDAGGSAEQRCPCGVCIGRDENLAVLQLCRIGERVQYARATLRNIPGWHTARAAPAQAGPDP